MVSFLALFWLYFGSNNFDWHKYENKFFNNTDNKYSEKQWKPLSLSYPPRSLNSKQGAGKPLIRVPGLFYASVTLL